MPRASISNPITVTCLLALGCTESRTTTRPDDDAKGELAGLPSFARPEPVPLAADQALLVAQIQIERPREWRFEPGGRRVAARLGPECGVWQLGSGDFLGRVGPEVAGDPCGTWPQNVPLVLPEDAGNFTLAHADGRQLMVAGERFELGGSKPLQNRLREGRRYRAAVFSPDGARLALFVAGERSPLTVEIWDLGTRRLAHELMVEPEVNDTLTHFWLHWTEHSLIAVARTKPEPCDGDPATPAPYCDNWYVGRGESHIVEVWRHADRTPELVEPIDDYYGTPRIETLYLEPDQRWLFGLTERIEGRSGTAFSFFEIPLQAEPDDETARTGLTWWTNGLDGRGTPPPVRSQGWSDAVGSSFWEVEEYGTEYGDWLSARWTMLSLTPVPERGVEVQWSDGSVLDEDVGEHAWRIELAARTTLLADVDKCPPKWLIDEASEAGEVLPCTSDRVVPESCELIDASWAGDRVLVACDQRWLLASLLGEASAGDGPSADAGGIDLAGALELARGTGSPRQVVWGPRGMALWTFGEGLRLFAGERLVTTDTTVSDLHRATLDEELDLALVRTPEGLRVVDVASGELGPVLAWTERVEHAAFSPDRRRVAIAGASELAVFDRGASSPSFRSRTGKLAGVAFRQDGEVLWVGGARALPEVPLDPTSGELVESALLDRVAFDRIAAADLDPSWRWAIEEDGTVLRTIDGQGLLVSWDGESAMSESGWLQGSPERFDQRLRIGPSPLAPVYRLETVADQLARPQLMREFFSGQALPRPSVRAPSPTSEPAGEPKP
ncbi:hypothetical protein ACNOYE_23395 [Nannocystaceae bacterium ST9]